MTKIHKSDVKEIRKSVVLQNDGLSVFGVLHLPIAKKKSPIVLFCHGLAGHKTGKNRVYVELAEKLLEIGIASLRFDCRGSGDSQGLFYDVVPQDNISDCLLMIKYLEDLSEIDTGRIGIFGRSYGGVVGIESAANHSKIKSIALWCPMFSGQQWQDQWQLLVTDSVEPHQADEMMKVNGQQGSKAFFEEFMAIDVTNSLKKLNHIPLLHIHGENDTHVSMQHAIQYEHCRKTAEAETKYIRLPQTDHDFSNYEEKHLSMDETVKWFQKTL